jgi:hypothetical protein
VDREIFCEEADKIRAQFEEVRMGRWEGRGVEGRLRKAYGGNIPYSNALYDMRPALRRQVQ